jgi:hypothetical protein
VDVVRRLLALAPDEAALFDLPSTSPNGGICALAGHEPTAVLVGCPPGFLPGLPGFVVVVLVCDVCGAGLCPDCQGGGVTTRGRRCEACEGSGVVS